MTDNDYFDSYFEGPPSPPYGRKAPTLKERARLSSLVNTLKGDEAAPYDPHEIVMVPMRRSELAALGTVTYEPDPVSPWIALVRQLGIDMQRRAKLVDDGATVDQALDGSSSALPLGERAMEWAFTVPPRTRRPFNPTDLKKA